MDSNLIIYINYISKNIDFVYNDYGYRVFYVTIRIGAELFYPDEKFSFYLLSFVKYIY